MLCPGNHEYYFDYSAWMCHLTGFCILMLPNAHTVLARGEGRLVLAGVTEVSALQFGEAPPDINTALSGAPAGAPVLLLDHQPRNARQAATHGVALQLSGHTHGGMISGLDRALAGPNSGFVSGRYTIGDVTLSRQQRHRLVARLRTPAGPST